MPSPPCPVLDSGGDWSQVYCSIFLEGYLIPVGGLYCTSFSRATYHFLLNFTPKEKNVGSCRVGGGRGFYTSQGILWLLPGSIYTNSKTLTDSEDTELFALSASAKEAKIIKIPLLYISNHYKLHLMSFNSLVPKFILEIQKYQAISISRSSLPWQEQTFKGSWDATLP